MTIVRLQYVSHFFTVLFLFGGNTNTKVTCQKFLLVSSDVIGFVIPQLLYRPNNARYQPVLAPGRINPMSSFLTRQNFYSSAVNPATSK
jgi:hypothetical protein